MPQGLVALLPLIFSGAAAATTIGTSIYSAENQPGMPKPVVPTQAQTDATAASARKTQEAALSQQLPGLQAQTGGSLSPEALLQLSQLLSGQAGTPGIGGSVQDLLSKMGSGGSSSPGLTPGGAFG
jgi:hypothetical protein